MLWTQLAISAAGVLATFFVGAYLLRSTKAKQDAETTGVHLDNQAKQISILEIRITGLQAELDEQRKRRQDERDRMEQHIQKLEDHTKRARARIDALEAFIRLNTEHDPAHIQ